MTAKKTFLLKKGILCFGLPTALVTFLLLEVYNNVDLSLNTFLRLILYIALIGFGGGLIWGNIMWNLFKANKDI